jgi:pyrimidine operon attenuation protein/uracil phosphoribosyltransferase
MTILLPDAEALCLALADAIRPHIDPARTALIGVHTGGVWVAERLALALRTQTPVGCIDVSYSRDDTTLNRLHVTANRTQLPFKVDGAHIIIVDDVLFTGRTIRAAINEVFEYGRPGLVELAVLVDRGSGELPIGPTYCPQTQLLPGATTLRLVRDETQRLSFRLVT